MQTVHCSNDENLLFPNILVAVAVLVPINNPQSRRKDSLIDKCYVARRTDRFFFCFNAHKHLLQKGDLAGVYRWPWCGKNSLKEVVNVPAIFFRRSAASQVFCTVEWRWRRTVYCFITFSPRNVPKTARFSLLLFCLWSFFTFLTYIQMLISEKFSWHNQPHRLGFSLSCFPWNGNFIPSWSEWGQETGKIFCSACAKWD